MHVLIFNLAMDEDHPALGFTASWVNAIAARVEKVSVVSMEKRRYEVAPNVAVYSLGKERGWSEPRRLAEFYRHCFRLQREPPRATVAFAHMAPLFSTLFAPVAKAVGVPVLLWYAHGAVPPGLRVAHRLADRCVTSTPAGFRLASNKLHVLGQGIDTTRSAPPPAARASGYESTLLSIGRVSATKSVGELLDALALLRREGRHGDLRLSVVGSAATPEDARYLRGLMRQVERLELAPAVDFVGRLSYREVNTAYHRGAIFVNLSRNRSLDKAILESMASGCIAISRNESFSSIALERGWSNLIPAPGAPALARRIEGVLQMTSLARTQLAGDLRSFVKAEHGLDALADKIVAHLRELSANQRC